MDMRKSPHKHAKGTAHIEKKLFAISGSRFHLERQLDTKLFEENEVDENPFHIEK